jgi:RNA polymerase sigma-70 factor (ECF subfamily)
LLNEHGDVLWRFVLARTRSRAVTEDVVQETLLAALRASHTYAGGSSERTWLLGIANNKVSDFFRKQARRQRIEGAALAGDDEGAPASVESRFASNGHWRASMLPRALSLGEARGMEGPRREELLAMLRACLEKLPPGLSEVIWMRDVLDVPTEEVCQQLGVTATNLWTRAHRARSAMRDCIEQREATAGRDAKA